MLHVCTELEEKEKELTGKDYKDHDDHSEHH